MMPPIASNRRRRTRALDGLDALVECSERSCSAASRSAPDRCARRPRAPACHRSRAADQTAVSYPDHHLDRGPVPRENAAGPSRHPRRCARWRRVDDDHRRQHLVDRWARASQSRRRDRRSARCRRRGRSPCAQRYALHREETKRAIDIDTPCTPAGPVFCAAGESGGRERVRRAEPGRSPSARLVSYARPVSGLSSGPPRSRLHPLPATSPQWVPEELRRCWLDSTTVAGSAGSDRLPVLPREPRGIT